MLFLALSRLPLYHIAKLRWFCEHVHGVPPSRWSVQDVEAFYEFLTEVPDWALCARDEMSGAYAGVDDEGYSPFRKQPSASSRSDIQRCIHAMFRVWREMGYIAINPMGLHGAGTTRKINAHRAVTSDLYDMVLDAMEVTEKVTFASRQAYTRDRFIFIALRELGLRASELIKATMGAFHSRADRSGGVPKLDGEDDGTRRPSYDLAPSERRYRQAPRYPADYRAGAGVAGTGPEGAALHLRTIGQRL